MTYMIQQIFEKLENTEAVIEYIDTAEEEKNRFNLK